MDREISIKAEPVDVHRCRFTVSEPLFAGVRRFTSPEEAQGSPLARLLFAIPVAQINEVTVGGDVVTVGKEDNAPWQVVGKAVGQAIRAALAGSEPAVAAVAPRPATAGGPGDDELYDRVADLFEEQINPMVARHGGAVELIDVQDAVVMLRMSGGCQGCGMASVTLRQGIEGMMRQYVPEVQGIVDVTDHNAGSNPYFAAAKK